MKQMKKTLALLIACTLIFSLFAGCSSKETAKPVTDASSTPTVAAEVPTIKLTIPTLYSVPSTENTEATAKVLNEYLDSKGYQFHVALEIMGPMDYFTQPFMALAGGEEMDVWMPFDGSDQALLNCVNNGYLLPIDEYLDKELADTMALDSIDKLMPICTLNGVTYQIPAMKGFTLAYSFLYNKEIAAELNLDMDSVKTISDLDAIFAAVKAAYPEMTVVGNVGNDSVGLDVGLGTDKYYQVMDICAGVTVSEGSTKAENYFRSQAFLDAVNTAYAWSQAGYTDPNSSANSEQTSIEENLFYNGQIFSMFGLYSNKPENVSAMLTNSYGRELGCIPLGNTCNATMVPSLGIAYTTKHPSECAQLINLMMTDPVVVNTVFYGVEGKDYVWATDDTVAYPEGVNMSTMEYGLGTINGMYGNQFITYPHVEGTHADDLEYMKELTNNATFSPLFGFTFDPSNVSSNMSAIANVIGQYRDALRYGDVDPETYLPQFWAALDEAGINDVIAEAQTQIDAYLAK